MHEHTIDDDQWLACEECRTQATVLFNDTPQIQALHRQELRNALRTLPETRKRVALDKALHAA